MVAIIDYGMGNVSSVQKALKKIGLMSNITADREEITKCTHVILPGVGSFNQAMKNLNERGLVDVLNEVVLEDKKPFLGICLGMQLLADFGLEDGEMPGLGFIKGTVKPIANHELPIPHMGWNEIYVKKNDFFANIQDNNFYFVHSYCFEVEDDSDIAATVQYGHSITAAVQKNNIFATQFHPEKSQSEGLEILKSFLQ
ncbi:imidazole glycerol phosphate synthase subunit HisH [Pedobacter hiemivivus]|uniref:Imidazole glycerol phosphate synthase subunit HisH n=1 Tax=Pedobacter hiemivivus TaxID=2530454 RepID=A0A4U1G3L6_9SPHI|nr:imidazole glycerol phosphate synthase subunit HisH [Pedobacter hiemivivus]TKC56943.1 imidazole glycerol phosphate synthase subunit HisH [Pedobacter hiemivivus]